MQKAWWISIANDKEETGVGVRVRVRVVKVKTLLAFDAGNSDNSCCKVDPGNIG